MTQTLFTGKTVPSSEAQFSGGLNSTASPLALANSESSDLQNIDFNKFGSLLKRNGYATLNDPAITNDPNSDGLFWYEYDNNGTPTQHAINIADAKMFKMDDLDGTWDDITGGLTITADKHCDFENWLNTVYCSNGANVPWKWTGSGNAALLDVPTGLSAAKYVKQFNNYLFLANTTVSGSYHPSRIYWSAIKDDTSWNAADFIEISKDDGQEITGIKVLADRLVVFKSRTIYNVFFTGDADIPFILPGGGRSASYVGCIAPFSIQEVENGLLFLSYDGLYFYDGLNSNKLSDKINDTFASLNLQKLSQAVSLVQKSKNRYLLSVTVSGGSTNSKILMFDYFNKAFSVYTGIAASAMATFFIENEEERPYFGDYDGFIYRMDTGLNDNPLGVETAIDAYYYTNWKHYGDICDQKGVPNTYIYYQISSSTLTFAYSYEFESSDEYTLSIDLSTSSDVYGVGLYGTATYARSGGFVKRADITGRGRVIRFKFANNAIDETFRIDGFGSLPYLETNN